MLKTYRAITQSLIDGEFGLDIAFPNIVFEPKKDGGGNPLPFIELVFGASARTPLTLDGEDGIDRVNGAFTVNIRYAINSGAVVAQDVAGRVMDYYANGKAFAYEGQAVSVVSASVEPGAPDFGWYKVMVTVRYESYQGRK